MIHTEKPKDGVYIVKPLAASLDYSATPELNRELTRLIEKGCRCIILDLDVVNFIDSLGLTAILKAQAAMATGAKLMACRAHARVASAFKLSRVDQTVSLTDDLDQALAQLDQL